MRTSPAPTFSRLTASIGVELAGIDLRGRLEPPVVGLLRNAVAEHHVVVVRGQFLTAEQHADVAEAFGPIMPSPVHLATRTAAAGHRRVSTIEDTASRPPAGFPWHTDVSWASTPPSFGFLSAVTIPAYGGDTLWASTAAVFDSLTDVERERCERSTVFHAPDASLLASVRRHHGMAVAARLQREHPGTEHPLVRVNPITGRKGLYLSPLYARRIVGPAGADGTLLQRLHGHLDDPHVQMRWRWSEGDFVIWDEVSTCHRALTDHHPQQRVMRRCVAGSGGGNQLPIV